MQDDNLTHMLAATVLIVPLTALGLIAVRFASRRALAWAQALNRVREARTIFFPVQILTGNGGTVRRWVWQS